VPFGDDCFGGPGDRQNLALIWGDSHAAALWWGLSKEASNHGFRLAQLTVSSCTPLVDAAGDGNIACPEMRARALAAIRSSKPEIVILAARWTFGYDEERVFSLLKPTADALQAAGVARVVVVGPLPTWKPTLGKALAQDMLQRHLKEPPENTTFGLQEKVFAIDRKLKTAAEAAGVDYISAVGSLCDHKICRTWADPESKTVLMAADDAHLTPEGSEVVAGLLSEKMFPVHRVAVASHKW
jgi:hypothetical protein